MFFFPLPHCGEPSNGEGRRSAVFRVNYGLTITQFQCVFALSPLLANGADIGAKQPAPRASFASLSSHEAAFESKDSQRFP